MGPPFVEGQFSKIRQNMQRILGHDDLISRTSLYNSNLFTFSSARLSRELWPSPSRPLRLGRPFLLQQGEEHSRPQGPHVQRPRARPVLDRRAAQMQWLRERVTMDVSSSIRSRGRPGDEFGFRVNAGGKLKVYSAEG